MRGEEIKQMLSQKNQFSQKNYNLAKNTKFFAKSIFSSSANVGLLMTNEGALKLWLWHQKEFGFGYLSGGRKIAKISHQTKTNRQ